MPKLVNRETVFPGTAGEFADACEKAYAAGVNMLGGCCGTNPEFIKALADRLKGKKPVQRKIKESFLISSRTKALNLHSETTLVMVGERINPTNRKRAVKNLRKWLRSEELKIIIIESTRLTGI